MSLEALHWLNCTSTFDLVEAGELEIHWITGTNNGTITDRGTGWTFNSLFTDCVTRFSEWMDIGTIRGGSPAGLEINAPLPSSSCTPGRWTATYTLTSPAAAIYVEGS